MSFVSFSCIITFLCLVSSGYTIPLLVCPPGEFGQDCTCQSPPLSSQANCANGTWVLPGPLSIGVGTSWNIRNDRITIQGNFVLPSGSFIVVDVDLINIQRSGFLTVNGQVDLSGGFRVNVVAWDTSISRTGLAVELLSYAARTESLPFQEFPSIEPGSLPTGECWKTGEEVYLFDPSNHILGTYVTIEKETMLPLCASSTALSKHTTLSSLFIYATLTFIFVRARMH